MKSTESIFSLINPTKLKSLLSFGVKGYLAEIGWFKALKSQSPVGSDGQAIPWVTYSFIDFISERIKKDHTIFEFGSGNSTIYYAKRAKKVVSVEHDKEWFDKISASAPSNSEMVFSELQTGGEYSKMPSAMEQQFDIIIVDGRDRVNCCYNSISALSENGVVVLDDSERLKYNDARIFFKKEGFKELSFSGISPGLFYRKSTSVFYRSQNCLDI